MQINFRRLIRPLRLTVRGMWRSEVLERFFGAISWEALAALGNSNIVRLTILVPLIGSLALFNSQIVRYLQLSSFFLNDIGLQEPDAAAYFNISRIYALYFGLTFLGIASFIYSLFVPSEFKRTSGLHSYVIEGEQIASSVNVKSDFQFLVHTVIDNSRGGIGESLDVRSMSFPLQVEMAIYSLGREMHEKFDWSQLDEGSDDDQIADNAGSAEETSSTSEQEMHEPEMDERLDFYKGSLDTNYETVSGFADIQSMFRDLYMRPRFQRAFFDSFMDTAMNFSKDILTLKYMIMNHSRATARMIVFLLYVVGFVILFVPSAHTFALVVSRVVRG